MSKNWKEILENNKDRMKILLDEFNKYYTLYNLHPAVLEYEHNLTNIKGKIQEQAKSNDDITEKINSLINEIKIDMESMNKTKKDLIPFIKDNASSIFKQDTNDEYNNQMTKNIEVGICIIILSLIFYKGTI
jgi:uncharacterized coiled-coil DUF342 family protein